MINKKSYLLLSAICLFGLVLMLGFIASAEGDTLTSTNMLVEKSTTIAEASSNFFGGTSGAGTNLTAKWSYLGKEWKTTLMKNPFVSIADSFFQSINFVFVILLAVDYSLSLAFSFILILWLYFFFMLRNILKVSLFSKWVCLIISFGLTIILAQAGLFSTISTFAMQLFFGAQTWWMQVLIGAGIFFVPVILFLFVARFGKQAAEKKKKQKDEMNRTKLDMGAKISEAMSHAFKKE